MSLIFSSFHSWGGAYRSPVSGAEHQKGMEGLYLVLVTNQSDVSRSSHCNIADFVQDRYAAEKNEQLVACLASSEPTSRSPFSQGCTLPDVSDASQEKKNFFVSRLTYDLFLCATLLGLQAINRGGQCSNA